MQARKSACYTSLGTAHIALNMVFRRTHSILFPGIMHDEAKEIILTHGYLMQKRCSPQDTFATQKVCCQP